MRWVIGLIAITCASGTAERVVWTMGAAALSDRRWSKSGRRWSKGGRRSSKVAAALPDASLVLPLPPTLPLPPPMPLLPPLPQPPPMPLPPMPLLPLLPPPLPPPSNAAAAAADPPAPRGVAPEAATVGGVWSKGPLPGCVQIWFVHMLKQMLRLLELGSDILRGTDHCGLVNPLGETSDDQADLVLANRSRTGARGGSGSAIVFPP